METSCEKTLPYDTRSSDVYRGFTDLDRTREALQTTTYASVQSGIFNHTMRGVSTFRRCFREAETESHLWADTYRVRYRTADECEDARGRLATAGAAPACPPTLQKKSLRSEMTRSRMPMTQDEFLGRRTAPCPPCPCSSFGSAAAPF